MNLLAAKLSELDNVRGRQENIHHWLLLVGLAIVGVLLSTFFWYLQTSFLASVVIEAMKKGL
jgi:hypothetical protein